MTYCSLLLSA